MRDGNGLAASYALPARKRLPRWLRDVTFSTRKLNLFAVLEVAALAAFVIMAGSTYLAFTNAPADGQMLPSQHVAFLLVGSLVPAMALLVLYGRRLAIRRAAGSTARLHVRLVFFFSLVAAVPTLLVAGFAAFLFQSGVDFWFSSDSRGLMENADDLARGYYEQNQQEVANETVAMAGDMRFFLERGSLADEGFIDFYRFQMQGREVTESAILQRLADGSFRTAALFGLQEGNEPARLAPALVDELNEGEPVAVTGDQTRIAALSPIDAESGIFLYNARGSEAAPFSQWEQARQVVEAYGALTNRARALQLRFNLALYLASLALVGLAVWFALRFADRQVQPLTELVTAARRVGAGNYALRVEGRTGADEIGLLNRAFNRMTARIESQTADLVAANRQLAERRAFIETVLESISAGILSLDAERRVVLANSSARSLLETRDRPVDTGTPLAGIAPQIAALVKSGLPDGIVSFSRDGELLTLAVSITASEGGAVITFEDITRQLLDQRQAAWSDVARRIAHEIKNPLTPIQLATERLSRRYRKQIADDVDLFDELTSTIVRQVGDLRKMVDEFSSFARLPKPLFRREDSIDLVRQAVFLQDVANPAIDFAVADETDGEGTISCDRHQFGQAMTNVLKNAVEAIEARSRCAGPDYAGRVRVRVNADLSALSVAVEDNGIGLPADRDRIVEPYVTTRERGTGLGLAIVNKIVEEHGGDMVFASGFEGGTRVVLRFAREPAERAAAGDEPGLADLVG